MAQERLLDYNDVTGVFSYHSYDEDKKENTIRQYQNVEASLEYVNALRNSSNNYFIDTARQIDKDNGAVGGHYAHIPVIIQHEMWQKYGIHFTGEQSFTPENKKKLMLALNGEYSRFKTSTMRLKL